MRERKVKRRRFKVLPLTFPFDAPKEWWKDCVETKDKIEPRFNRDGLYFDRQTRESWLEIDGEAWLYGAPEYFLHELAMSDGNNRMEECVFQALKTLRNHRVFSWRSEPRLEKLLQQETDKRQLRAVVMDARLWRFQWDKKRAKEKMEQQLVIDCVPYGVEQPTENKIVLYSEHYAEPL